MSAFTESGAAMPGALQIKFYTHPACPFAQRVWIALEASGLPFEMVEVNLYGSGGFDKTQLKKVEAAGGLAPKGYIPVMAIGDEVIRESSELVQRVAEMSEAATSLQPEEARVAEELIAMCNALPKQTSSRELEALLRKADACTGDGAFLAGGRSGMLKSLRFKTSRLSCRLFLKTTLSEKWAVFQALARCTQILEHFME